MSSLMTIGEFARATYLSVKALRHYDEVGLLHPADVDAGSGYRRYASAQVPGAQLIRRLRDLEMPLDTVRAVLDAPSVEARDEAIVSHLRRMEQTLERTQSTVASLRAILEGQGADLSVEIREVARTSALMVTGTVGWDETEEWLTAAFGELAAVLEPDPSARSGADSALYDAAFFESHIGTVSAYIPVARAIPVQGRVELADVEPARVAVAVHRGRFSEVDRAYGALGAFVTERVIGGDGPIREHYLIGEDDVDDPQDALTEVCWPIRETRAASH